MECVKPDIYEYMSLFHNGNEFVSPFIIIGITMDICLYMQCTYKVCVYMYCIGIYIYIYGIKLKTNPKEDLGFIRARFLLLIKLAFCTKMASKFKTFH